MLSGKSCTQATRRLSAATLAEPQNVQLFSLHFVFITLLQKHFPVFRQMDCHPGMFTHRWGRLRVICPPLYPVLIRRARHVLIFIRGVEGPIRSNGRETLTVREATNCSRPLTNESVGQQQEHCLSAASSPRGQSKHPEHTGLL